MPVEFEIDPERGVVFVTATGVLTPEEILSYPPRVIKHPDYDPSYHELVDGRHAEFTAITADTLYSLIGVGEGLGIDARHRIALVAPNELAFGVGRQYEMMVGETNNELRVFRTLDDARSWLGLDPA